MEGKLKKLKFVLAEKAAELVVALRDPTALEVALVMWALLTTWEEEKAKRKTKVNKE